MLSRSIVVVSLLVGAACSSPDSESVVATCQDALAVLSQCSDTEQAECAEDGAAAQRLAQEDCQGAAGKADWFGNRTWGENCTWNWQCQGDSRHSCNHGICYLRADKGNRCDRNDIADCRAGLKCADDLSVPTAPEGICRSTGREFVPALYAETIRPGEVAEFEEHAADIMALQVKAAMARLGGDDSFKRAFHTKKQACIVGEFESFAGPDVLAAGPVFSTPKKFPAWVRFSNGTLVPTPDDDSLTQGLAFKLMNVPGPKLLVGQEDAITQDFVMISSPANVVADANEFVEFAKAQSNGNKGIAHFLLTHPRTAVRILSGGRSDVKSSRTESYWGANANRWGDVAVKYSARPCPGTPGSHVILGDNRLRADMKVQLARGAVCFDFYGAASDRRAHHVHRGRDVHLGRARLGARAHGAPHDPEDRPGLTRGGRGGGSLQRAVVQIRGTARPSTGRWAT